MPPGMNGTPPVIKSDRGQRKQLAMLLQFDRRRGAAQSLLNAISQRQIGFDRTLRPEIREAVRPILEDGELGALAVRAYNTLFPLYTDAEAMLEKWQPNAIAMESEAELLTFQEKGIYGKTRIGSGSAVNQDGLAAQITEDGRIRLFLADGLERGGEVASAMTLTSLLGAKKEITHALLDVHGNLQALKSIYSDMATSTTAVEIEGNSATVNHYGDCLVFRLSGDKLEVLNKPHRFMSLGELEEGDPFAAKLPLSQKDANEMLDRFRNAPTAHLKNYSYALGYGVPEEGQEQPVLSHPLKGGDKLLVATKSVYTAVPLSEILLILAQPKPMHEIANDLLQQANAKKDATVILYEHTEVKEEALPAPAVARPGARIGVAAKPTPPVEIPDTALKENGTMAALRQKLGKVEGENQHLRGEVASLEGQLIAVKKQLDQAQKQAEAVDAAAARVPGLAKEAHQPIKVSREFYVNLENFNRAIAAAEGTIKSHETKQQQLTRDLESLNSGIADIEKNVEFTANQIKERSYTGYGETIEGFQESYDKMIKKIKEERAARVEIIKADYARQRSEAEREAAQAERAVQTELDKARKFLKDEDLLATTQATAEAKLHKIEAAKLSRLKELQEVEEKALAEDKAIAQKDRDIQRKNDQMVELIANEQAAMENDPAIKVLLGNLNRLETELNGLNSRRESVAKQLESAKATLQDAKKKLAELRGSRSQLINDEKDRLRHDKNEKQRLIEGFAAEAVDKLTEQYALAMNAIEALLKPEK